MSTQNSAPATAGQTWMGHPRGLATLFFTEMWERFSYYGMRAILVLAMVAAVETGGLGLDDRTAAAVYGLYTAAVYITALPGGWVADRLLGLQQGVWYGGILIAMGHFTMAMPFLPCFYIGMLFIALGTGLLKPNVSALVGELYSQDEPERRDAAFSIYYMGINLGGMCGPLICGYLGEKVGWHYGFGAAGVLMVLGLIQYRLTRAQLLGHGAAPSSTGDTVRDNKLRKQGWTITLICLAVIAAVVVGAISGLLTIEPVSIAQGTSGVIAALAVIYFAAVLIFGGLNRVERGKVAAIAVLVAAVAVFWSGFEQAGSSFNLFADRYTDRVIFGWEMPTSWLQSVNSLFIILLAPVFAALWLRLGARHMNPSTPLKFALGLVQLGLGFLVLYFASRLVLDGDKVLPTWLILTYLVHTTGELCISPVGLSAVTKLAPGRYVGQMMGTWFMGAAMGNLIAGLVAGHLGEDSVAGMPGRFLSVFLTMSAAGVVMVALTPWVKKLMADVK